MPRREIRSVGRWVGVASAHATCCCSFLFFFHAPSFWSKEPLLPPSVFTRSARGARARFDLAQVRLVKGQSGARLAASSQARKTQPVGVEGERGLKSNNMPTPHPETPF